MSNMVLGGYTFDWQPTSMTMMQKDRSVAYQETYSSVAAFSWGASYAGKVIELGWNAMTSSQYTSLLALLVADAAIVFDPQDGLSKTFNVEVLSINGEYFVQLSDVAGHYRRNVKMQLLILSEV